MIKKQVYISNSPEETFAIGKKLTTTLNGGEVLALSGDLGAGKTVFIQGLAAGLRVKELVNSPTYTIMKLYKANKGLIKQLCHIDAYRLNSDSELSDIGVDEYFGQADTISAVEWAEKVKSVLPKNMFNISIKTLEKNKREIYF